MERESGHAAEHGACAGAVASHGRNEKTPLEIREETDRGQEAGLVSSCSTQTTEAGFACRPRGAAGGDERVSDAGEGICQEAVNR